MLKKFRIKKDKISLQGFIFINVIAVTAFLVIAYALVSSRIHYKSFERKLISDMEAQCKIISDNVVTNNFMVPAIDTCTDSIAATFEGRILLVDRDYKIIKDTFHTEQGTFIIYDKLIDIMENTHKMSIDKKEDYVQLIYPVISDEEIMGAIIMNASYHSMNDAYRDAQIKNSIWIGIILVINVLFALYVGRGSVREIKKINNKMENFRDGHLGEKIEISSFKEFKTFTENYNKTIGKLMMIDTTRQEFVSNVSHELKTPITSMKVLADSLVQNQDADLDMYKEFMTDIVEEIDRETKIINDLLTLVKMDKKEAEISIAETNINELLEMIVKRVSPIAASRGIEISLENYRDVNAEVDEVKLSLALTNIIENAVKYNIDNGWVKVTLNSDHKFFYIKVSDSGVGIPDDCKEHVFERFYRVDKARSRDTGGTGLGLAITQNAIRMHNGSIKLYSEPGEGTTFTIKVPIKYAESE